MPDGHDQRLLPLRDNIAARHLQGHVSAEAFVDGQEMCIQAATVALRRRPSPDSGRDTDLLFGEPFTQYGRCGDWVWGQSGLDGYVGYLPATALITAQQSPSHRVIAPAAHCYAEPDLKSPPVRRLSYASRVRVGEAGKDFAQIQDGSWLFRKQLAPLTEPCASPVTEARKLIGLPYLWGGRSADGLDCSALIQLALQQCGIDCPRDSDQQESGLGEALSSDTPHSDLKAGDLLYFQGHVVMALGDDTVIHANAFDMQVSIHPLRDVLQRADAEGLPLRMIKRLP